MSKRIVPTLRPSLSDRFKAFKYERRLNRRIAEALRNEPLVAPEAVEAFFGQFQPRAIDVPLKRVGGKFDGGYVVPDDFSGIEASYSPGVATEMDFDLEIAEMGIPGFLIDASIQGIAKTHPNIRFERLFLGERTGGEFISLPDWIARNTPDAKELLLQIDIEGAEYKCLNATPRADLDRFRIIVIEFHDLHRAFTEEHHAVMRETLDRLNESHLPVHIHHNNCLPPARYGAFTFPEVFEVTYIRKDRCKEQGETSLIPHPLDRPNLPQEIDWIIPEFWHRP